jgi:hypothetical protein
MARQEVGIGRLGAEARGRLLAISVHSRKAAAMRH